MNGTVKAVPESLPLSNFTSKLDLGLVYRPHCVRSVLTTSVKILPYRPPARLIRAKYNAMKRAIYKIYTFSRNNMCTHYLGIVHKKTSTGICIDRIQSQPIF